MKSVIFASLLAVASAFAPATKPTFPTSLNGYENELGVIAPTGFFDPLGLSKGIDQATFDRYRASELKHGRVCMLGIIGYVWPEFGRAHYDFIPGEISTDTIPNGIKAIEAIPALGWAQMFFLIGAVDYYGFLFYPDANPTLEPEELERRQLSELQHGRLAMLGFLELVRHDCHVTYGGGELDQGLTNLITGFPFLYNDVLSGSS
ncbi:hypothetical protein ACA910_020612 [Epithemia clementina (nom. ined.)]